MGYSLRTVMKRADLLVELTAPNLEWLHSNLRNELESGLVEKDGLGSQEMQANASRPQTLKTLVAL